MLFDFFCEDGFLVVFCCRLLPLLSPGCVGVGRGELNCRFLVLQEEREKKRGLRGPFAGSTGLEKKEKAEGKDGKKNGKEGEGERRVEKL